MQPTFLGKLTVASAGTPVPLSTDAAVRACTILVATVPGLTGNIYFGGAAMNQSTLAGVMVKFNAPAVLGQPDHFISANAGRAQFTARVGLFHRCVGER